MKKIIYVLLLLLIVSPLFSGVFEPVITLNKSLNILLDKNTKLKYPTDDQANPLYAFDFFPWGSQIFNNNSSYGSFIKNMVSAIPRLVKTLYKASKIKNHMSATSIIKFIIDPNKRFADPKEYKKSDQPLALIWKRKQATLRQAIHNFVKNNIITVVVIQELYDKQWIDKKTYKKAILRFRGKLKTYKKISWKLGGWLLKHDKDKLDILLTGKLHLRNLKSLYREPADFAAEYYIKNFETIMSNPHLSSNITALTKNRTMKETYTNFNQLKKTIHSSYLIPIIVGIGSILLITLGFIFLKKKKKQ